MSLVQSGPASWRVSVPQQAPPSVPPPRDRIVIGTDQPSAQWGLLGRASGGPVALDLAGSQTISLFGVQGFGKSYTLGAIAEMAAMPIERVNHLPHPVAVLVFHYHRSDAYPPELIDARMPNDDGSARARLTALGIEPQGVRDVVLLVPPGKVSSRRRELPDVDVRPIGFGSRELGAEGWRLLLGASGNDALYLRQLVSVLRRRRDALDLDTIRRDLSALDLTPAVRRLVDDRLTLATEYVSEQADLAGVFRPGRMVIVDLRDEWIERDEALVLFVTLMRILGHAGPGDSAPFNKLVVFDEAHKYFRDSEVLVEVVETIREARHLGTTIVIASQDPISMPRAVVELSSTLILHRLTSPSWLKHLKGAISALETVTDRDVGSLNPGHALVWSQRSTDPRFTERPQPVEIRVRVTKHGGVTRTAGRLTI